MDLQNLLKRIKLNENNISMALGVLILIVVGAIVVNYFRNQTPSDTLPSGVATQATPTTLPTKHVVAKGETLWSIAEKYYKSGYNWVDIQTANKLANASSIEVGQELTIPDVTAKTATTTDSTKSGQIAEATATPKATAEPLETATPEASSKPVAETTKGGVPLTNSKTAVKSVGEAISTDSYTVIKGDNLWDIAVRAYGDGYKWSQIAKANKLSHPGVIHAGNKLALPR